jgi:hypothetical protein
VQASFPAEVLSKQVIPVCQEWNENATENATNWIQKQDGGLVSVLPKGFAVESAKEKEMPQLSCGISLVSLAVTLNLEIRTKGGASFPPSLYH